jgi:hypothetical protein
MHHQAMMLRVVECSDEVHCPPASSLIDLAKDVWWLLLAKAKKSGQANPICTFRAAIYLSV